MRFFKSIICSVAAGALAASTAWAGGVDNNNDFNAAKYRTFARAASTDVDAAIYNPAGLTKLEDGFYALLGNAVILSNYEHKLSTGEKFKGTAFTPLFPAAVLTYKYKDFAGYFNFTVPGGGGSAKFDDGSISTYMQANTMAQGLVAAVSSGMVMDGHPTNLKQTVNGSSAYMGYTLGAAYKLHDMVSVSLGGRFLTGKTTQDMEVSMGMTGAGFPVPDFGVSLDYGTEKTASGYGGIVGLNLTPMENLNIGMRYETNSQLEFKNKITKNEVSLTGTGIPAANLAAIQASIVKSLEDMNKDGAKSHRDLPAMSSLGAAYTIIPALTVAGEFNWYYNSFARWEDADKHRASNFDLAVAAEYTIIEKLKGSVGFSFARQGSTDTNFGSYETPSLSAYVPGLGLQYEVIPGLKVDVAYCMPIYKSITTATDVELSRSRHAGAISLQYKIM